MHPVGSVTSSHDALELDTSFYLTCNSNVTFGVVFV